MRQLPSAQTILEQAIRRAHEAGTERVNEVRLAVGELIALNEQTFRADWSALAEASVLVGATLHIRRIPAEFQCMACFNRYLPAGPEPACPNCGGVGAKVLAGEEFRLEEIR